MNWHPPIRGLNPERVPQGDHPGAFGNTTRTRVWTSTVTRARRSSLSKPGTSSASCLSQAQRPARPGGCAHEDLPMLVEQCELPDLKPFRKMPEGEVLRVAISFALVYTKDYWGECDVDLEIGRCRVLRRQKPRKERYISKKDRK